MHLKYAVAPLVIGAIAAPVAIASAAGSPAAVRDHAATTTTVAVRNTSFGKVLVTGSGKPLYLYTSDSSHTSKCSGACATAWPPLIKHGTLKAGTGAHAGKLGTIMRGNQRQVTYGGHPLYTFIQDSPGHPTGEGSQVPPGKFFLVKANGHKR